MKIVAGMGSIDEYERFVEARADEFFCGYVPYSWSKKYGTIMPLNRREVLCYNVQLGAFSELEILSDMIKKYKKRQYIYKKCIIIYKETQQTNEKTCAKIIKKINISNKNCK